MLRLVQVEGTVRVAQVEHAVPGRVVHRLEAARAMQAHAHHAHAAQRETAPLLLGLARVRVWMRVRVRVRVRGGWG